MSLKSNEILSIEFNLNSNYQTYDKQAKTMLDLLGNVGGVLAIFMTVTTLFFGGLVQHYQNINYLMAEDV